MNVTKPKIYVETTIPSFYHEDRIDVAAVARREWTHQWWTNKRQNYDLLTSIAVLNELENGDYPKKENCLNLLNDLLLVTIEPEIIDLDFGHFEVLTRGGGRQRPQWGILCG
jgi:hypothetical protein